MTHRPGDLVGIPFPYSDMTTTKRRPVLVVTTPDRHGDFMGLAVTSVVTEASAIAIDAGDMALGKLPKNSWVRYDKLFTLSSEIITKTYGSLRPESLQSVITCLCDYIGCDAMGTQAFDSGVKDDP